MTLIYLAGFFCSGADVILIILPIIIVYAYKKKKILGRLQFAISLEDTL